MPWAPFPPTRPYAHTKQNTLPSSCLCAAPREEEKALPFSYIGFGGGRHGCMGQNFAYLQVCHLCVCALWLVG